jgi:hypothetical protein
MELAILMHIDQHKFVNLRSLQVLKPFSNTSVYNAAAAQISRQFRHESVCSMQQSYCVLAHSSFLGLLLQVTQRYNKYILTNILSSNSAARGVAWQLDSYGCKSTKSSNQLLNKIISEAAHHLIKLSHF